MGKTQLKEPVSYWRRSRRDYGKDEGFGDESMIFPRVRIEEGCGNSRSCMLDVRSRALWLVYFWGCTSVSPDLVNVN